MIASPCVYEAAIQDGETGLLARTMADWASHLTLLAADPEAPKPDRGGGRGARFGTAG